MPLNSTEFAFAVDKETLRDVKAIHAFLKANNDKAYTAEEVAEAVNQGLEETKQILEKLDDLDLAIGGTVRGQLYFHYRADLPLSVR
jgi:hypothetical protein